MGLEPRTYLINRAKARKAYFKVASFFGFLIAFNLFSMALPNRGHHSNDPVHFAVSVAIVVMLLYLIIKIRPDYGQTIEVSEEGISWTSGKERRVSISWREMGALESASNRPGFFILNKSGTKTIKVNQWFDGFDQLKAQVQGEREKYSPEEELEAQVFAMPPSVKATFLFSGICFSLFSAGSMVLFLHELFFRSPTERTSQIFGIILGGVSAIAYGSIAYYCWTRGSRIPWSKIEISGGGIARVEKDGRKTFMDWGEICGITLRNRMKDLLVQDQFGGRVVVDYQFQGFEVIRERICREFMERIQMPALPVTYGSLRALPDPWLMSFCAILGVGLVCLKVAGVFNSDQTVFWVLGFLGLVIFLALLSGDIKKVKALTIRQDGLVLCRMTGKLELAWSDILDINLERVVAGQAGIMYFPRIRTTRGEYSFSRSLNKKIEIILTAKRATGEMGRG